MNLHERKLSYQARKKLPKSDFVFPKEKRYPIEDKAHARNALARVAQHGSSSEKAKVRAAVHSKYPDIGEGHLHEAVCSNCGEHVPDSEIYHSRHPVAGAIDKEIPVCFQCYYKLSPTEPWRPHPDFYPPNEEPEPLDARVRRPFYSRGLNLRTADFTDVEEMLDAMVPWPPIDERSQHAIGAELEKEHFSHGKPKDTTPGEVADTHLGENPKYYPTSRKPKGAKEALRWVK